MRKIALLALAAAMSASCALAADMTVTKAEKAGGVKIEKDPLEAVFTINAGTLKTYAWTNDEQVSGGVKVVALDVQGLNNGHAYKTVPESHDIDLGGRGVLVVRPYSGPWNWMGFESIKEIDLVLDAVWDKFKLSAETPLVLFGRSMGGIGVLNYARYGRHAPAAVACNSPVTDLAYHATERPDCAATMYRAYSYYDCPLPAAIALHNPMRFMKELPDVPYLVIHGGADVAVSKKAHSDIFVPAMRELGYNVAYVEVPDMIHVDLLGHPEALKAYLDFIASAGK